MLNAVRECLVRALQLNDAGALQIDESTTAADVKGWTSVAHLSLVLELEKTFGVRFENEEIVSMGSIGAILERLRSKGVKDPAG